MPIESDEELRQAIAAAGNLLQEIQDYVGRDFTTPAKVRFPRGYLRTAAQARQRLAFLEPSHLRSNISYTMMLTDVQHWLLARTDLSGTAREMVVKLQIFLLGTIVESITKVHLSGKCGGNYKRRTEYMVEQEIISPVLKTELDWLWDIRNNMHLFQLDDSEWLSTEYTTGNHNRAVKAFQRLVEVLNEA